MIRKGLKPRFRFRVDLGGQAGTLRRVLPFRRSWTAIGVLALLDAVFFLPAFAVYSQASEQWSQFDSLFDLTFALFASAWLLGWSVALVLMSVVLVVLLFGREVLRARPGEVELFLGLPGLGIAAIYDVSHMRNLRALQAEPQSGTAWRGSHLAFDYGANTATFGSAVDQEEASALIHQIEAATGTTIRTGAASAEESQTPWETSKVSPDIEPSVVSPADEPPLTLFSPSSLVLIAANLVPVAGTIFLDWKLSDVMVLYWAESAVIGLFTICKMILIGRWMALLSVPFFIGHFGAFMAVHFLFIYAFFVEGLGQGATTSGDLSKVGAIFIILWPAMLALFLSHGFSFVQNFVGRQEYHRRTLKDQMSEPYNRIIYMQLVLIFGGWVVMLLGAPEIVLFIVICLKIYFDLKAHVKEHHATVTTTPNQ